MSPARPVGPVCHQHVYGATTDGNEPDEELAPL